MRTTTLHYNKTQPSIGFDMREVVGLRSININKRICGREMLEQTTLSQFVKSIEEANRDMDKEAERLRSNTFEDKVQTDNKPFIVVDKTIGV
jgi:ABC-type molybdenum transport system ATPase subunit/photorepair protein PhrA